MNLTEMERLSASLTPRKLNERELARLPEQIRHWLRISELVGPNGPKMAFGPFRQMLDGAICLANQTAITGTAEAAMFPVAQYSGFAANQLRAGQLWRLTAFGIITTSTTPGNITITPRFGTSTSGTSLGASTATALTASVTNIPWRFEYDFIIRSVGNAGANSNVVGNGHFHAGVAVIAASVGNDLVMGSTANVAVDTSIASGLFIGVTLGAATVSMTTMGVMLESYN